MSEPKIEKFREILFWPLFLHPPEGGDALAWDTRRLDRFQAWFCAKGSPWRPRDAGAGYAEFVYFHPFVQRFLYGAPRDGGTAGAPSLRCFARTDLPHLWVTLPAAWDKALSKDGKDVLKPGAALRLEVLRLHFYLFETGVAVMVLEVGAELPQGWTLRHWEDLLDSLRRAYPPYWETRWVEEQPGRPAVEQPVAGHCPWAASWSEPAQTGRCADYREDGRHRRFAETHRAPPVAAHWRHALEPLLPYPERDGGAFRYQQIEDERMPFMAWLAVDRPFELQRGDFVRLCFADDAGDSHRLPYAGDFLADFEKKHCYDRYWDPQQKSRQNWMNTRYLCCGYGFAMVGSAQSGMFTDGATGLLAHFRHHYFQMGLIAHFHKAALLMLSDRTADAVARYREGGKLGAFRRDMQAVQQAFLQFTHRYWFHEVSNQLQARELFALWTGHLGTQALFDQVRQEVQDANAFLSGQVQQRIATVGLWLAGLGLPLGALGVLFAFLALDPAAYPAVAVVRQCLAELWGGLVDFAHGCAALWAAFFLAAAAAVWLAWRQRQRPSGGW